MNGLIRNCALAALFFALLIAASAQQDSSMSLADYARKVQQKTAPANQPNPSNQTAAPGGTLADHARNIQGKELAAVKITPQQAKDILNSVDVLLKFASEDSGLPIRATVKRRIISRDDLSSSMDERKADDEETQRLQAEELSLKKFGYLSRAFSTSKFVTDLFTERVEAYYDSRTKQISLLNWVPPAEQMGVMAHELTHALQDQNFNLLTWERDRTPKKGTAAAFQVTSKEALAESEARQAVVEGQATIVLIDHQLQEHGLDTTLEHLPNATEALAQYMSMVLPDSPAIHAAPVFIRESMLFPYREGLIFELELLQKKSKQLAFSGVFAHPPINSHQVLHPEVYLRHEETRVPSIPNVSQFVADKYEVSDSGGMGELDVRSLIKQLGGTRQAESIARGWRGGSYLALKRKGVPTDKATTADIALMYVSDWDSLEIARRFARFYADAVPRRYKEATPISISCKGQDCPIENYQFNTEEGLVTIECRPDNLVVVTESFEPNVANAIVAATLKANSGPDARKTAAVGVPDLTLRYASSPAFAALSDLWTKGMVRAISQEAVRVLERKQ
jgi:hypothetical protein